MDTTNLNPLLDTLSTNIDDLEKALTPLLHPAGLSAAASKLPLLDKAKLYVLSTYAIESILFSYLRLNGVNAKDHPVFTELTRVKQYFEKLKNAEQGPAKRNMTLDTAAAGRFVKAGLAGNEQYDKERAERQARERAAAEAKMAKLDAKTRMKEMKERMDEESAGRKRKANDEGELVHEEPEPEEPEEGSGATPKADKKRRKKGKRQSAIEMEDMEKLEPKNEERIIPSNKKHKAKSSKPPKGPKEAFQALLKGKKGGA